MKEIIKKNINIIIPISLLLVLLIALLLYGREYKNNRFTKETDTKVYQYFSGMKIDYTAKIGRNKKEVILSFASKDEVVNLDSTPIYIEKKDSVIFPKEMMIFFPIKDIAYKTSSFSEVYKKNNIYYLRQKRLEKSYDHIFYYDGKDLYFFIDPVTLTVGDKTIELSSMSYVSCSYNNLLEYYDKANDTYEKINLSNEKVTVKNEYMTIDIGLDKVEFKNGFTLLAGDFTRLKYLSDIENK